MATDPIFQTATIEYLNPSTSNFMRPGTPRHDGKRHRIGIQQRLGCSSLTSQLGVDASVRFRRKKARARASKSFTFWETQKRKFDTIDRSLLSSELMLMFDLFELDIYHRGKLESISDAGVMCGVTGRQSSYGYTFPSLGSIMYKFERRLLIGIDRATSIDAKDVLIQVTLRVCESARLWDAHVDRMLLASNIFQTQLVAGPDDLIPSLLTTVNKDSSDLVLLYPWGDILRALTASEAIIPASIDRISCYVKSRAGQLTQLKRDLACANISSAIDGLAHLIDSLATTLFDHAMELSS